MEREKLFLSLSVSHVQLNFKHWWILVIKYLAIEVHWLVYNVAACEKLDSFVELSALPLTTIMVA